MAIPVTGCKCRFQVPGFQCSRPGGAERAAKYLFPPQLGGSYVACEARYHGGLESCRDREISPDMVKTVHVKVAGKWRFGVVYRTNESPDTPKGAKMLEQWSWTDGYGPDVVIHYAQAIAWVGELPETRGLEEVDADEMAQTLGARKNQRAFNCLSDFGLTAEEADRAGCSIYHTTGDWAVCATRALVRALQGAP